MYVTTPQWKSKLQIQHLPEYPGTFELFNWSDDAQETNERHWSGYMDFLNTISWPEGHSIVDAARCNIFPGVILGQYRFSGSIDVILLDNGSIESYNYTNNIRLGIEVEKKIEEKHHNQACMEHLCASSLNWNRTVLTVLTDLNESWFFLYFGLNSNLHKIKTDSRAAKFLLENMFNHAKLPEWYFPEDFPNRLTWNEFVSSSSQFLPGTSLQQHHNDDDRDKHGKQNEDDRTDTYPKKHGECLSKRRDNNQNNSVGIRGDVGRSAMLHVANDLDLLDFIDNDKERIQIVMNYVSHTAAPMFQLSVLPDEKVESSRPSSPTTLATTTPSTGHHHQNKHNVTATSKTSPCHDGFAVLSEQNLLQHNARYNIELDVGRDKGEQGYRFSNRIPVLHDDLSTGTTGSSTKK